LKGFDLRLKINFSEDFTPDEVGLVEKSRGGRTTGANREKPDKTKHFAFKESFCRKTPERKL
jgi:hypothetical protein